MLQRSYLTTPIIQSTIDAHLAEHSPSPDIFSSYQIFQNIPILFYTEQHDEESTLDIHIMIKVETVLFFCLQLSVDGEITYQTPWVSVDDRDKAEDALELLYQHYATTHSQNIS